ncbi:hypothetical protein H4S04_008056 [Coemansia sp. S16]|nr:hypothetical protein H4S04_008056 [Coemansia sp. S16]
MVKEMAHSVHACTLRSKRAGAGKVIFINRDDPPKGWEDIFDYYVAGDSDRAISLLPIASTTANVPEPIPPLPTVDIADSPSPPAAVPRQRLPAAKRATKTLTVPVKKKSNASLSELLAPANNRVCVARKLAASGAVAKPAKTPRKLTSMMKVVKSSATAKRQQKALPVSPSSPVMSPS